MAETVSIITIFFNAERFLREAIESVFAQTYGHWELLLVDDGSTDYGTAIAQEYARAHPSRVRYFDHPEHSNRGMSVSRNLGLRHATREYIGFLDADDVWLPEKLERQVRLLAAHPEAAMVYGPAYIWYGWTGIPEDRARDGLQDLGVPSGLLVQPPDLLRVYLRAEETIPSPSGILVRAEPLRRLGGFEDEFRGMYEDQALYVKLGLEAPILISEQGWYRYRHHPDSCSAVAFRMGRHDEARRAFLGWTSRYMGSRGVQAPELERVVRGELAKLEPATGIRKAAHVAARMFLPAEARRWLRTLEQAWLGWR